jgi:hypothetical protein
MIRVGLNKKEKEEVLNKYLRENDIRKIFVLYFQKHEDIFDLEGNVEIEYIEYKDIIEYPVFYRLLEEIDDDVLIVVNECMRTQNRRELTYNCAHHYLNQTDHKIIFEYFPFIEEKKDFLILLDFQNKGKYRGKGFKWKYLYEEDILVKRNDLIFKSIDVKLTERQVKSYLKKKDYYFDNLGNSDPDTLPRNLHNFLGKFKKAVLHENEIYLARNQRLKLPNIVTYRNVTQGNLTIIDFPCRRLEFIDYVKSTGTNEVRFVNTCIGADKWYFEDYNKWNERLGEFYAKTSLY